MLQYRFIAKNKVAPGSGGDMLHLNEFTITEITSKNYIISGIIPSGKSYSKKIQVKDFENFCKKYDRVLK